MDEAIDELDVLLTGRRLSASMPIVRQAYENAAEDERVRAAQQTIVMTPEFNTLGDSPALGLRPPTEHAVTPPARSYKAVVMLYLAGGVDSFNLIVPCPGERTGIFQEYTNRRMDVAMAASELLPISTTNQSCTTFGVHHKLPFLKALYDQGQAAFVSNIGSLERPLTARQYRAGGARCHGLFSHSDQSVAAATLQCQVPGSSPRGSGGRMADALSQGNMSFTTESFAVGGGLWTRGFHVHPTAVDRRHGVVRFAHGDELQETVKDLASHEHGNIYCEEYAKILAEAIDSSENLAGYFDDTTLQTDLAQAGSSLGQQLKQVSRLIAARGPEHRNTERDFFQIGLSGFDTHSAVKAGLELKFEEINDALQLFVEEMRQQGVFDDVVLVAQSDFGRALASNGRGTAHGWAGNTFLLGGSVKGGHIYNDFLESYLPGSEQDIGRGRLVPRYPWESMMVPVAQWMGVEEDQLLDVFPNYGNFDDSHIIDLDALFRSRDN